MSKWLKTSRAGSPAPSQVSNAHNAQNTYGQKDRDTDTTDNKIAAEHYASPRNHHQSTDQGQVESPAPNQVSTIHNGQNINYQSDTDTTNNTISAQQYTLPSIYHQSTRQSQVESSALGQQLYSGYKINYGDRDQNIYSGDGAMNIYNGPASTAISKNKIQEALEAIQYSYRHDSQARFPQPKCSEGTREKILKDLLQWAYLDPSQDDLGVCWLRGSAGVGKSAIAQTIAERCEKDQLLASFFFSRTDPNRNTTKYLALVIADGLIKAHPTLQEMILQVVNNTPAILHMTLEAQFRALVIEPLLKWRNEAPESLSMLHTFTVPSLVIIDGLDECLKPVDQKEVLSLVLLAMKEKLPISFLICSRPEPQIRQAFCQSNLHHFTKHVSLNGDPNVNQDIRTMLCTEFDRICNSDRCKHMNFPSPWPCKVDLETLVDKASGQFIYPATILKFIDDEYSHPCVQLQHILDLVSIDPEVYDAPPYHDLDVLYMHILKSAAKDCQKLLRVVAAVLLLEPFKRATPERIEQLLMLPPGDVVLILHKMHSLLHVQGNQDEITVYHASFVDFLFDQSRSKEFFIDDNWLSLLLNPLRYKIIPKSFYPHTRINETLIEFVSAISQSDVKLAKVLDTAIVKFPLIFCMLWNWHSQCSGISLFTEELDAIVKCLQYISSRDRYSLLESIQVSVDLEYLNLQGFNPTICLQEMLHWRFRGKATNFFQVPEDFWGWNFPTITPPDSITCGCHTESLAEPILCCMKKHTVFHLSVTRAIAELFQSELDYYIQESATRFSRRSNLILKYCSTELKLLPYSRLIQLIDFWCNLISGEDHLVLEWLKAFPPAYSELVKPHIREVTRMIDKWNDNVRELRGDTTYDDWCDFKQARINEMAKPIYRKLRRHRKTMLKPAFWSTNCTVLFL